ncbi:MAG: carbohydrate ABC transporter permease [Firmicutes bacterium]|nr:carbohydrate ABC transporter permease [Bacillota bacterium]
MNRHDSKSDRIVVFIDYILLIILILITLYPFWDLVVLSISPRNEALSSGLRLFTLNPDFQAYKQVFESPEVWRSFYNSIIRVIAGTSISVFFTALTAYPLSKKDLPLNKIITGLILFTMMFSGGLIPGYLLMKSLGILDTLWVLILPGAVGAYNIIIMRNFLRTLPDSLEESAKIDGAKDFTIWWQIVLPLSTPVLATVTLWVAVGHWNAYFDALIYITDRSKYVLPVLLRRILLENQIEMYLPGQADTSGVIVKPTEETVKAATIVISAIPIIMVYPFLQKHFTKGIVLGAVKG